MTAVTTDVVEGAEFAVVAAHQQEALSTDGNRRLRTRRVHVEVGGTPDAHPRALEQVTLFPREHLGRVVRLGRQRPGAVVRLQHLLDAGEIQRRGRALHRCSLIDDGLRQPIGATGPDVNTVVNPRSGAGVERLEQRTLAVTRQTSLEALDTAATI